MQVTLPPESEMRASSWVSGTYPGSPSGYGTSTGWAFLAPAGFGKSVFEVVWPLSPDRKRTDDATDPSWHETHPVVTVGISMTLAPDVTNVRPPTANTSGEVHREVCGGVRASAQPANREKPATIPMKN